jgi:phosphomannomutase
VIEGMVQLLEAGEENVVGFEANGGFLVGSTITKNCAVLAPLMTRDAVLPILCLFSMARGSGVKVSALAKRLPARFTASDRLQAFPTETSRGILADLAASPDAVDALLGGVCGKAEGFDRTDGLRILLAGDEIVHFRPSGNAPELRCYAESSNPERAVFLVQECLRRVKTMLDGVPLPNQG